MMNNVQKFIDELNVEKSRVNEKLLDTILRGSDRVKHQLEGMLHTLDFCITKAELLLKTGRKQQP